MPTSDSVDYDLPDSDSYTVNLAGLSNRERRAAVAAIEEIVGPLRDAGAAETGGTTPSASEPVRNQAKPSSC